MTEPRPTNPETIADGDPRLLTVPNVLSFSRIVGSVVLVGIAWVGAEHWFIGLFILFLFTDWLDGKLAILLDQRTVLGARLDTVGDVVMYWSLFFGVLLLEPQFVRETWILLAVLLASHLLSGAVAMVKFHRTPAYHTRAAKTCWLLMAVGGVTLLAGGPWWPAQAAAVAVILTNVQSIAISITLPRWEADVSSWWHARRIADRIAEDGRGVGA